MKRKLFHRVSAGLMALCLTAGLSGAYAYDTGAAGKDIYFESNAYIDAGHELWMKGNNQYGQLGLGYISGSDEEAHGWTKVMEDAASICNMSGMTAVIKTDGSLWMWGLNDYNQLGFTGGNSTVTMGEFIIPCQTVPVKVMDDVAAVAMSGKHTAAIKTDGSLWMWGSNGYGAIGDGNGGASYSRKHPDGTTENVHSITEAPVKVMDDVAVVSCGDDFTAAVKTDGSLWAWGKNTDGRLGTNFTHDGSNASHLWQTTPVKVMDNVASVSCGGGLSYAMVILKTDGTVWACGSHEYHKTGEEWTLADGYYLRAQPVPIQITDGGAAVYSVFDLAAVLKKDGSLWTWGSYYLGDGTIYSSKEAVHIANDVLDVSLQDRTFVKRDGTTWIWSNYYPVQFGSGILSRLKPVVCAGYEERRYDLPDGYPVQGDSEPIPETGVAKEVNLTVAIDGTPVEFQAYALTDSKGGVTNYLKLRSVALALNDTRARFNVDWEDGFVTIMEDWKYRVVGGENETAFSGDQLYRRASAPTLINGASIPMEAIVLTDSAGKDYTYYKLRDLGKMLDFDVSWSAETGVAINTQEMYSGD